MLTALRYPTIESRTTLCPSDDVIIAAHLSHRNLAAKTYTLWPTRKCLDWLMDTAKFLPAGGCASFFTGKARPTSPECADEGGRIYRAALGEWAERGSAGELVGRILTQARTQVAVLPDVP